jgi:ABC-type multidrug transport system fused ATPase/permease subunit
VGERGRHLSGGQRQRIAIARALIRNPTILLLDEGTSALDHHAEAALMNRLRRLAGTLTIINVTHRLGAARDADRILVIEKGAISGDGTHEELINSSSFYAAFWRKQFIKPFQQYRRT